MSTIYQKNHPNRPDDPMAARLGAVCQSVSSSKCSAPEVRAPRGREDARTAAVVLLDVQEV